MKLSFFCLAALTLAARAGDFVSPPPEPATEKTPFTLPMEIDTSYSFVGGAEVRREGRSTSFTENEFRAHLLFNPKTSYGYLRLGAEWERHSFSLANRSPLPNTLQAINLVLGLDFSMGDSILLRVEAQPGFYGTFTDHLSLREFNVPFVIGGTWLYSEDLQLVLGVSVDFHRGYPVLPGGGIRWKFAPHLVLNAVLPTPRLEYEYSKALTFYAGAELREETYRMEGDYGDSHREPSLNHALLTYSELRLGGGFIHKLPSGLTLSAEGGCQTYREFDFDRANIRYRAQGASPYGQVSLHAAF